MKLTDAGHFDIVIIGAGPAGCCCAIHLAKAGLNVAIVEKRKQSIEKVCGGGLTYKTIQCIQSMGSNVFERFLNIPEKILTSGAKFYTPDNSSVLLSVSDEQYLQGAAGYFMRRKYFDDFLFNELKGFRNITVLENFKALQYSTDNKIATVNFEESSLTCKMIVFADGSNSIVYKNYPKRALLKNSHIIATRGYFRSETGTPDTNFAEFYFTKELVPGYLWIFPLPGNTFNVGFYVQTGMESNRVKKTSDIFNGLVNDHTLISHRFKNLEPIGRLQNGIIPIWNRHHILSGERFVVTGDAAHLVDPFSGEGIGNAMLSGEIAADKIVSCFEAQNFSTTFLKDYDKSIRAAIWPEINTSRKILRIIKHPWLFNWIAHKTIKIPGYEQKLGNVYFNVDKRIRLFNPSRIFKLILFGK